ncbi:MAG: SGNH/GDSL hydrolase family protein [Ruminococcaceae bacterium]|nr:SGNH/GDSL hydrolase family protein [Oscillospiraceae bacterium]
MLSRGDSMSEFIYETNTISKILEDYEWDNVWWEQTNNETAKRILYIGDSISCGTRRLVTSLSKSEILCDGFGTSKALDNPHFKPSLELFMKQQSKCDAILFNNGLHGWHLSDEEYEKYYDEMLLFLRKAEKPIFIVLTTDVVMNQSHNEIVKARNEIAKGLARKYHFPVIDLHTVASNNAEYHDPDGVHFNAKGYELLAKCILESIA